MAFEIPQGLNPDLMALAWMVGRWEGVGNGQWPDRGEFTYGAQLDFSHNGGSYLYYVSQLFELDDNGEATRTMSMETGFWRPQRDASLEVVMCHPDGYSEVWFGNIAGAKIELTTDAVVRTVTAATSYTAGHRLYGNVEGDLLFTFDRATADLDLQNYLYARLQRTVSPLTATAAE